MQTFRQSPPLTPSATLVYVRPFLGPSLKTRIWRIMQETAAVTAVAWMSMASPVRAEPRPACLGVNLPAGLKKVSVDEKADCRFSTSMGWEEARKALDKTVPTAQSRWHREVNIPAAKYIHIESTNPKSAWEGINMYQVGGDASPEIRVFVIPRPVQAEPVKESEPKGKKKETSKRKKGK